MGSLGGPGYVSRRSIYVCKTTGVEKVRTTVTIRRDLYEKVIELAHRVYGLQRGALERAIEDALEMWLMHHVGGAGAAANPRAPLKERYNAVMECIEEELGTVPATVPQIHLERCIADRFNVKDERSILGWIHRFYMAGLIKPLTIERVLRPRDWKRNTAVEIVAKRV